MSKSAEDRCKNLCNFFMGVPARSSEWLLLRDGDTCKSLQRIFCAMLGEHFLELPRSP